LNIREVEQVKLTVTWLNTIAAGSTVIGSVTPLAIVGRNMEQTGTWAGQVGDGWVALGTLVWLPAGMTIHWLARRYLRRLAP